MFEGTKVLVTGGTGLIGSHVVEALLRRGARVRTVVHHRPSPFGREVESLRGDLRDMSVCRSAVRGMDAVVHAAAVTGGSATVAVRSRQTFTDNVLLNTQVLAASQEEGVRRYGFLSNSSVYPRGEELLREETAGGASGAPPENHTGLVKILGEEQCRIYAERAGMAVVVVRGGNAYGPRDDFDLETSHVLPALIRKAVERQDPLPLWGDGTARRDFTHARDIAEGLLHLMAAGAPCQPVNVATGRLTSIREALQVILDIVGHRPRIVLEAGRPATSPAKRMDVERMRRLGFAPAVALEDGLRETIEWYRREQAAAGGPAPGPA